MSPSPSPSPPPQAQKKQPPTLQRPPSSRKRPTASEPPAPVQASSASIYSHNRQDDDDYSDEDRTHNRQYASKKEDQPEHDEEDDHDDRDEAIEDDEDYPEPDEEGGDSILPPPNFQPFFALITDPATQEMHHPHVYYVFSDDAETEREGHDVTTVASLRALDQTAQLVHRQPGQPAKDIAEDDEVEERYVILDLETSVTEDGSTNFNVKHVSSLSPAWAVTNVRLEPAPSFEEERSDSDPGALMLLLEGIELSESGTESSVKKTKNVTGKTKKDDAERRAADLLTEARKRGGGVPGVNGTILQGMDEVWRGMNERMGVLEKVLGDERSEREEQR